MSSRAVAKKLAKKVYDKRDENFKMSDTQKLKYFKNDVSNQQRILKSQLKEMKEKFHEKEDELFKYKVKSKDRYEKKCKEL